MSAEISYRGEQVRPWPGTKVVPSTARTVVFSSSLRGDWCPCISHVTLDGNRTPRGRSVEAAATSEDIEAHIPPDCRICRKAWDRLPEST